MDYRQILNENLEDIRALLKINSIRDKSSITKEAPYGKGIAEALAFMKELAIKDGFIVKDYDHQAISVSYVNKPERHIDIASHLDVVTVDNKWTVDPFGAVIKDGKLYGRGTIDMKVPLFLTYIALKSLRTKYPDTPNEIRLVFGCDEERAMADMRYYVTQVSEPLFTFTPDGKFPLAKGEKGALMWTINGTYEGEIEQFVGGEQCNIVPAICKATLKNADHYKEVADYLKQHNVAGKVEVRDGKCYIETSGLAVHSSRSWLGKNADIAMLKILANVLKDKYCQNLVDIFEEPFGAGLGCKTDEEFDTCLTVNLGVFKITDGKIYGQVDGRYPISLTSEKLTKELQRRCLLACSLDYDDPPTYVSEDDPYVKCLLDNYREITGDNSKPVVSGGISYSKVFGHCVSYGIADAVGPYLAHQADEYIGIDETIRALEIYTKAIEKLAFLEV